MNGCTSSSDPDRDTISELAHVSKKQRGLQFSLATHYDNDPLEPYQQQIIHKMRTNGSLRSLRDEIDFIPESRSNLLDELSRQTLDVRNHIALSRFSYLVIREVENLTAAVADGEDGVLSSVESEAQIKHNVRNMERLLRNISDFVLRYRFDQYTMDEEMQNGGTAGLNSADTSVNTKTRLKNYAGDLPDVLRESHRAVLWIARCKLIDALRTVAEMPIDLDTIHEPMRMRAEALSDERFARWMHARGVCDRSVIITDPDGAVTGHRVGSCNLMSLWLTIKQTLTHWPMLPYDEFTYRLFDELVRRVAFFISYREIVDPATSSGRALLELTDRSRRKVLGLALSMWHVRDIVAGTRNSLQSQQSLESPTVLNMVAFVDVAEAAGYAHINQRFIGETERVFAALERSLRSAAGFRWHLGRSLADPEPRCLVCQELERINALHVRRFEEFCADQMKGIFKDFVREAFHDRVYSLYLKPSDAERFRRLNPADVSSARNIISREQRELHNHINKQFIVPMMDKVWESLRGNPSEPAYTLLAALAARYSVQQLADGARMDRYIVSTSLLDPYEYNDERIDKSRSDFDALHTRLETTGTLRFRNKLAQSHGLLAPVGEIDYQHPVILHAMNSILVHSNGHLHTAPLGFGQAFIVWLGAMCRDEMIGGQMSNRALLHAMWRNLAPDRTDEANKLEERTKRRVARWDPITQVLNCDRELARLDAMPKAGRSAGRLSQF